MFPSSNLGIAICCGDSDTLYMIALYQRLYLIATFSEGPAKSYAKWSNEATLLETPQIHLGELAVAYWDVGFTPWRLCNLYCCS